MNVEEATMSSGKCWLDTDRKIASSTVLLLRRNILSGVFCQVVHKLHHIRMTDGQKIRENNLSGLQERLCCTRVFTRFSIRANASLGITFSMVFFFSNPASTKKLKGNLLETENRVMFGGNLVNIQHVKRDF